jgi:hypothetical protein
MTAEPSAAPQRWWHDVRWIAALVGVAFVGTLLWGLFGPEPRIVVSRETTFITAPLRPDGLPDYPAHALDLLGRDVPPEDNAAVALLHATWPMDLEAPQLTAVRRALGIPDTPPDVAPIVWAETDEALKLALNELLGPLPPASADVPVPADARRTEIDLVIGRSQGTPWTAAECPPLAAWVARNSPALDAVVAGADRPTYVMPPADLLVATPDRSLLNSTPADLVPLRYVTRALSSRAMLHLGEGRTMAAWRDIHAIHRLGRLVAPAGRARRLIAHLIGVAVQATACSFTLQVLDAPGLTADEAAAIRRDLAALPERAEMLDALLTDRLEVVDLVVQAAAMSREKRRQVWCAYLNIDDDWRLRTSLDLNVVLRKLNAYYDRVEVAVREADRPARLLAFDAIDRDLAAAGLKPTGWRRAVRILRAALHRQARSADVGDFLVAQLSGMLTYDAAYERTRAEFALVVVAAALAEYRARGLGGPEHPYPDRLDALVPEMLAEIPRDPFSGGPLTYERRGDGYLLYAVGANGVDDGGTSGDVVKGEWQPEEPFGTGSSREHGLDTVIRLPMPRRGILPAPPAPAAGSAPPQRP